MANKWMSHLSESLKLSEIVIPGTHNSCAINCNSFAKCQSKTLMEQLYLGVRALDIRCRQIYDHFEINHGLVKLNFDFNNVQCDCVEFLQANPQETIIMIIKSEYKPFHNKLSFEEIFLKYIANNLHMWHLDEHIPILKEVRGKIVLLRRFGSSDSSLGINLVNWPDNQTFLIQNKLDFQLNIQDEHKKKASKKWNSIHSHLNKAASDTNKSTWYINFCSSHRHRSISSPEKISKFINKKLVEHFNNIESRSYFYKYGTIFTDFVDESISKSIYKLNRPIGVIQNRTFIEYKMTIIEN